MAKPDAEFKKQIKLLSKNVLEEMVIRAATRDKDIHDFLLINYLDKEFGEKDLFEEAITDIQLLFTKNYKGSSEELRLASMIDACVKRINRFQKIRKNKNFEADLILMVLDEIFGYSNKLFGTCFTRYDYKVGILLKRLITLVASKLHPDFKIEYSNKINQYLNILHNTSDHLNSIYALPKEI